MKLYRLAEAFTVLSMAGLAGWSFGRLQVKNFEFAEAFYESHIHRYDLARAQHPPRPPRAAPPPKVGGCTLDRATLLSPRSEDFSRTARIVPSFVDGKPLGFKLYAIAPYSIYARVGLRNGDSIRRINGFDLTAPDNGLAAYAAIKQASHLVIDLDRAGAPLQLTCALR